MYLVLRWLNVFIFKLLESYMYDSYYKMYTH